MYLESKASAEEWLGYVCQPFVPGMIVQSANAAQIMAPANGSGVGNYVEKAAAAAS